MRPLRRSSRSPGGRFYQPLRALAPFCKLGDIRTCVMDEHKSPDYQGAPPAKSSLGACLLNQARDLRTTIDSLTRDAASDHGEIVKLQGLVDQLLAEAERSTKVQAAQAVELEQVRQLAKRTQQQLSGVKISRGIHKARAQKLLNDMEHRLN